jgi:trehalose 6-phosphate synthase
MKVEDVRKVRLATIDVSPVDYDEFYKGYANRTLWPILHYRLDIADFDRGFEQGYRRVNEHFAERLRPLIEPDDTIWVHDYHFIPMGERLRERGFTNRIGFFLHIPWPPTRLLVMLPYHERLVRTVLHYDLVGFQCDEWLESFLHYCRKELGAEVDEATGRIELDGQVTHARAYPIGIDYEQFTREGQSGEARQAEQRMLSSTRHRTAIIGVDRLDYSKGLVSRLDGIARLFETDPGTNREIIYVQIAPPTREDVRSYQEIREVLERKTGHINGEYSEIDIVPIRYVNKGHSTAELYGIYRASKIGLVTPLRDGMNLVAKEYVAAQDPDDPGVLILSRFAGAAQQLKDALLVNPYNPDDIADALRRALAMPLAERKARWKKLVANVREENVQRWTANFTRDLEAARELA